MQQFQYSIVYGLLNIETIERLSVGIIYVADGKISFRYSQKKLSALKPLLNPACYKALCGIVTSMDKNNSLESPERINYLSRYSNNLIQFSPLTTIDLEPTPKNFRWLFESYVYKKPESVTGL